MTRLSKMIKEGQETWCDGSSPDNSPSRCDKAYDLKCSPGVGQVIESILESCSMV